MQKKSTDVDVVLSDLENPTGTDWFQHLDGHGTESGDGTHPTVDLQPVPFPDDDVVMEDEDAAMLAKFCNQVFSHVMSTMGGRQQEMPADKLR